MNGKTLRITPRQTPSIVWLSSIPRTPKVPHDVKSWQKRDRSPLLSRPAAPARAMVEPERQAAGRTPAAQEGLQRGGNTANPRSSSLRLSRSEQLDRMIEPL